MMTSSPALSVVIPTCGRPPLLRRCLEALLRQTLPAREFEIIVVDDGRSPLTAAVVRELAQRNGSPSMRYLLPQPGAKGPASARNRGWQASTAPVIAFTDDDTIPDEHWLEQGLRALSPAGAVRQRSAVWGHVSVPIPPVPTDNEKNTKGLEGAIFVTANVFILRGALQRVGGFDERFKRAWREDTDLYFALLRNAEAMDAAPDAIVLHPAREAPWGVSIKQQANVLFDALLFKKYPRQYREFVRPGTPWHYYLVVLGTLGALACAFMGEWGWTMGLTLLSLWVIATLAFKRLQGTLHTPSHVMEMLVTSFALPFLSVYWRLRGAWRFKVLFL